MRTKYRYPDRKSAEDAATAHVNNECMLEHCLRMMMDGDRSIVTIKAKGEPYAILLFPRRMNTPVAVFSFHPKGQSRTVRIMPDLAGEYRNRCSLLPTCDEDRSVRDMMSAAMIASERIIRGESVAA